MYDFKKLVLTDGSSLTVQLHNRQKSETFEIRNSESKKIKMFNYQKFSIESGQFLQNLRVLRAETS